MKKKLQVFVSSTYTDLIEERQAAVQAILDAGHIPAGMELFKAGNESQLKTIYKWIDQSDVYMLILGGRYGSIEEKSKKSYTQLEYEYALSKDIPVFAVIISDAFLTNKINRMGLSNVTETSAPDKYKDFKSLVMSKVIRPVDDCKDIKIAIHTTLNEFINEYDLTGWIRLTSENDSTQLLKENNCLIKENNTLTKEIQKLKAQLNEKTQEKIGHYSFDQLIKIFKEKKFNIPSKVAKQTHDITIDALSLFTIYFDNFVTGISNEITSSDDEAHVFYHIAPFFISFDLLETTKLAKTTAQRIQITKNGSRFYSMLAVNNMIKS